MLRTLWITLAVTASVLVTAGCGSVATATPTPVLLDPFEDSEPNQVRASAVVVPVQQVRLSFVISGIVENVAVKEGDQVQTGQTLVKLDTTALEYDLISAQAALTSAEIDAQLQRQLRRRFNTDSFNFEYVSPPGEKIRIADAEVEQLHAALETVKASIAQGTLTAPIDSTVVEVNVSPGEYVQPSQVVIVLADLQNVRIETTDLSELNVSSVEIGQPATVYIEALDKEFPGKVTAISPIAGTIGGDVIFKVTIKLDEQPQELLWGMSADVEINVKE